MSAKEREVYSGRMGCLSATASIAVVADSVQWWDSDIVHGIEVLEVLCQRVHTIMASFYYEWVASGAASSGHFFSSFALLAL